MGIEVRRVEDIRPPSDDCPVTLKQMGDNIFEVRFILREQGGTIQKLNAEEYVDLSTGEVKQFEHTAETRADNLTTVRQSLRDLRDIINCNINDSERCIWLTLTYRENMRDPARLYADMDKFTKRMRYYLKNNGMPDMEYIYCIEPQARGAFHAHCVLIFDSEKAPFIHNDIMARIWQHGFTKTQSLKGVNNPGLYLTAYLADIDFKQAIRLGVDGNVVKELSITDEDGKPIKKAVLKGARLRLYPAGMRIFRVSRGIKRPVVTRTTEGEAMKIIGDAPLTFERTIRVGDEESIFNTINYRHFNRKGKPKDDDTLPPL